MYHNYHKHTHYSNVMTIDCTSKPEDFMKRAKELGHTTYFTTEHGWQGNIFEAKQLCDKYGLKMIVGCEAYYVDNRFDKTSRKNYHLCIIALTNKGRRQMNAILSEANKTGFYYKPRIDLELLLSLNPEDVVITTACVAGRLFATEGYEEEFLLPLYRHFQDHLFLEIQNHNAPVQKEWNQKILTLHKKYGIKLIHGNDSHYIYPQDAANRDLLLKAKGIVYGDEDTFILDYPDRKTIMRRYQEQGVISYDLAKEAIDNTLIFDQAEDVDLNTDIKLPKIFPEKDSCQYLGKIIAQEFPKRIPKDLTPEKKQEYINAVTYEFDIIKRCGMADYFLIDYFVVKKAVSDYNLVLTRSGRGSAVSFLINYILGFTQIDRLRSPIRLYPTRFMSAERILKTRSLPDIDLNMMDVAPILKASKDYMGEDGVYYMVSFKPMRDSSAFRMYCKAIGMQIDDYSEIAKDLDSYREDPKWKDLIKKSEIFLGVIDAISPSPCSVLLLDQPISEEVGLIKVGDVICCCIDGYQCDCYKYLKNDYLVVQVYTIISGVYERIGRPIDDINELVRLTENNPKVWDLFEKGITTAINQCDSDYDKQILKKYKPKNVAELSAYVASIRPGFKSLLNQFIERRPYSTGVEKLDALLDDSYHYMMYQESIMTYLNWLGIDESETYDIIKKISKKKFKEAELESLKSELKQSWIDRIGSEQGFAETWQVMNDASRYSFNASHSLSVAYDALYGAYLKAEYSLDFYAVALNLYSGDEERTKNLTSELQNFGIRLKPAKFRKSSADYTTDPETNTIYKGVGSIKYLNQDVGMNLFALKDTVAPDFISLLYEIKNSEMVINSRQMQILIALGYFEEYGDAGYLQTVYELFSEIGKRKTIKKNSAICEKYGLTEEMLRSVCIKETKSQFSIDSERLLRAFCPNIHYLPQTPEERIRAEAEYLGYIEYKDPKLKGKSVVLSADTKWTPRLKMYSVKNGTIVDCKIDRKIFKKNPLSKGDLCKILAIQKKQKSYKDENGRWVKKEGDFETYLTKYEKIETLA